MKPRTGSRRRTRHTQHGPPGRSQNRGRRWRRHDRSCTGQVRDGVSPCGAPARFYTAGWPAMTTDRRQTGAGADTVTHLAQMQTRQPQQVHRESPRDRAPKHITSERSVRSAPLGCARTRWRQPHPTSARRSFAARGRRMARHSRWLPELPFLAQPRRRTAAHTKIRTISGPALARTSRRLLLCLVSMGTAAVPPGDKESAGCHRIEVPLAP